MIGAWVRNLSGLALASVVMVMSVHAAPASTAPSALSSLAGGNVVGMPAPLSFQAWKALRVDEARMVLDRMRAEEMREKTATIDRSPPGEKPLRVAAPSTTPNRRIEQARLNLEIAQDLTVNDFLVIYLPQFKTREALTDVARRLAPEDVAELLMSLQRLQGSTSGSSDRFLSTPDRLGSAH